MMITRTRCSGCDDHVRWDGKLVVILMITRTRCSGCDDHVRWDGKLVVLLLTCTVYVGCAYAVRVQLGHIV